MPSTLISIHRERPAAERTAMIEAVQAALVEGLKIPPDDRCVRLRSYARGDFITKAAYSENLTLIEIDLFHGRTLAAKKNLYQALVRNLAPFGVPAGEVKVLLRELPRENWGLRGGLPASEVELGFKVEV